MVEPFDLRMTSVLLNRGASHVPPLGGGTLIPDAGTTESAINEEDIGDTFVLLFLNPLKNEECSAGWSVVRSPG